MEQTAKKPSDLIREEMRKGAAGENEGIPFGNPRIDHHIQIRSSSLYLAGGFAGSGKTSLVDELFVLQAFDYLKKINKLDKYKIIYWSMERPKVHKLCKWLSRRVWLQYGKIVDFKRIMGWFNKSEPLTKYEKDMCEAEMPYIDELFSTILKDSFHTGRMNPTGIRKYITEKYIPTIGKVDESDKYNKVFIPNNPELITLQIFDHIGKIKGEQGKKRKELLDDFSDDCSNEYRDLYGISSVFVSQFNRTIANPMRIKNGDVEPMPEDFKETGDIYEDADVVFTLFDPWRYKVPDPSGYTLDKLKDMDGKKYYRNVKLMKNNYGAEDIRFGFGYQPETGIFKLLPKQRDITERDYQTVLDNSFFSEM